MVTEMFSSRVHTSVELLFYADVLLPNNDVLSLGEGKIMSVRCRTSKRRTSRVHAFMGSRPSLSSLPRFREQSGIPRLAGGKDGFRCLEQYWLGSDLWSDGRI